MYLVNSGEQEVRLMHYTLFGKFALLYTNNILVVFMFFLKFFLYGLVTNFLQAKFSIEFLLHKDDFF